MSFQEHIQAGYDFEGPSICFGAAVYQNQPVQGLQVRMPLNTVNRHGVIAGATGTGKTKSLQVFAEQLSLQGVPCVLMDIKGDLSGLAKPGSSNKHVVHRCLAAQIDYNPTGFPVEPMSFSGEKGVAMKATVSEFGPVLLAKILDLNDTQESVLAVLFKYSDDHRMPLINLEDLKGLLRYANDEGKAEIGKEYGFISPASINAILRRIIALEQEGGEAFFGEPSFEIQDFIRRDRDGKGVLSVIRLMDMQSKPRLFSTFMLCLLTELYAKLPEEGDPEKPKLAFFIDEAHLIFQNASGPLLDQIEVIIKLIRSKGVGIFFITQNPEDIPEDILGQCGLKIQHALRAFTAKDRRQIKRSAENFPISEFYNPAQGLTELGVGEAFISVLNEKGRPTPLAHTLMRPPLSRMDVISKSELNELVKNSDLAKKYNREIDTESAEEILKEKIEQAEKKRGEEEKLKKHLKKAGRQRKKTEPESVLSEMSKNTMVRQIGRTIFRELTRGILGVLGAK